MNLIFSQRQFDNLSGYKYSLDQIFSCGVLRNQFAGVPIVCAIHLAQLIPGAQRRRFFVCGFREIVFVRGNAACTAASAFSKSE